MTAVPELTNEQLDELRRDLQEMKELLEKVLEHSAAGAAPVELDKPIGRLSRMDEMQQQEMVKASRRSQEVRLAQVRAALQRFNDGEYGECPACGDTIAFRRLKAKPESRFCVPCQQSRES